MNTSLIPVATTTLAQIAAPPVTRLADGLFVADWTDFLFAHFSLPAAALAPHVPFELDLHEGRAFVSLVAFDLKRLRLAGTCNATRWLLHPMSDHPFLNVRTYVVHEGRPGICFLAEWIPNPLSLLFGPLTYGLPYRRGVFARESRPATGLGRIEVTGPAEDAALALTYPLAQDELAPCAPGGVDAFLLERYTAYTFRGRTRRRFEVAHTPWLARRADWLRFDTTLVEKVFPWFDAATFHSAHVSPGVRDVQMGRPHRLA